MLFHLADFIIDVDVERTRAFYERSDVPSTSQGCTCPGCQNFDKAILTAPASVTDFLHSLGIDPRKPVETYSVTGEREADGTVWYQGWYHVCGKVIKNSGNVQVRMDDNCREIVTYDWTKAYPPDAEYPFEIMPVLEPDLLHADFPTPAIQLDFDTHLPYVLQESR